MERVLWPMDPVEPKMASFFTTLFSQIPLLTFADSVVQLLVQIEGGCCASFLEGNGVEAVVDVEDREKEGEEGTDFNVPTLDFPVIALNFVAEGEGSGDPHKADEIGEIVEEKLFYDLVGLLRQIGVMPGAGAEKAA